MHIIIDRTQSFTESFFSDLVSFGSLTFCIWFSADSKWWTLVSGILFLFFTYGRIAATLKIQQKPFKTKQELIEWAETLDWEENS